MVSVTLQSRDQPHAVESGQVKYIDKENISFFYSTLVALQSVSGIPCCSLAMSRPDVDVMQVMLLLNDIWWFRPWSSMSTTQIVFVLYNLLFLKIVYFLFVFWTNSQFFACYNYVDK